MIRTSYRYAETVVRLRATAVTDPYSGEVTGRSWAAPSRKAISGVILAYASSTEPVADNRNAVITGLSASFPRGTDLTRFDRIEAHGLVYEVDGDVGEPVHPITGTRPGLIAALKRIGG